MTRFDRPAAHADLLTLASARDRATTQGIRLLVALACGLLLLGVVLGTLLGLVLGGSL